jgi:hypothetical protein
MLTFFKTDSTSRPWFVKGQQRLRAMRVTGDPDVTMVD